MLGYQALCLQDGGQYTEREHTTGKQTQGLNSIFFLIIVAPVLKVVWILFQTFHLDSLILFKYRRTLYMHNLKTVWP